MSDRKTIVVENGTLYTLESQSELQKRIHSQGIKGFCPYKRGGRRSSRSSTEKGIS